MPLVRTAILLSLFALGSCGFVRPGTPGHEPPTGGRYNPVSHEENESGR